MARRKAPKKRKRTKHQGPWFIELFLRHKHEQAVPGKSFLEGCPDKVRQTMFAVLKAVAEAPPPSFSGGGYWEAMHDEMAG